MEALYIIIKPLKMQGERIQKFNYTRLKTRFDWVNLNTS